MDEMSLVWQRSRRLAGTIAVALTAVVGLLILLVSQASAVRVAGGAFGCGGFAAAVEKAQPGQRVVQMVPARNSDDAIITKSLAIIGGWTRFDASNCPDANVIITGPQGMLDNGFDYVAPITRSVLENNSHPIIRLSLENEQLLIEHMTLRNNNGENIRYGTGISGTLIDSKARFNNLLFENNRTQQGTGQPYSGGGASLLLHNSHLLIKDSIFDENASVRGGALFVDLRNGSVLTIENTLFHRNNGESGGGLHAIVDDSSRLVVKDSQFQRNYTQLTYNNGGGIWLEVNGGTAEFENMSFEGNNSGERGGGVYALMDGGELQFKNTQFTGNDADDFGSGLYVESIGSEDATVRLVNTRFIDNGSAGQYQSIRSGTGALNEQELTAQIMLPFVNNGTSAEVKTARIISITRRVNYDYAVYWEANFDPDVSDVHLHFFFNTVSVENAGVPGNGPWILYGGGSPFTEYSFVDRPDGLNGATQMCVLVANPNHSIRPGTGNCYDLPEG